MLLYGDKQRETAEHVVHKMVKRAVEMEGTVTVSFPQCIDYPVVLLTRYRANTGSVW